MPALVFVDENNIQNLVEWKGTETTGKQKGSKATLKKGIHEQGASSYKCKTKKFLEIHLKYSCVSRKGNVDILCKFNIVSFCINLFVFHEEKCLDDVTTKLCHIAGSNTPSLNCRPVIVADRNVCFVQIFRVTSSLIQI